LVAGAGGFVDITAAAKKIVFSGLFTVGAVALCALGESVRQVFALAGHEVTIYDSVKTSLNGAKARILAIVDPPKADVGATYLGRVVNVTKFGAFVNILPGRDGLIHISKLGKGKRINNVEDVLTLGQEIEVIVEEIDEKGKVSLTPCPSWNPFPNSDSAGDGRLDLADHDGDPVVRRRPRRVPRGRRRRRRDLGDEAGGRLA